MLGIVTASGLIRSTVLAAVITFVFIAAFTVYPYLKNKGKPQTAAAPTEAGTAVPAGTGSAGPRRSLGHRSGSRHGCGPAGHFGFAGCKSGRRAGRSAEPARSVGSEELRPEAEPVGKQHRRHL